MIAIRRLNYPAAGNAGFGVLFAIGRQWPDVPQPAC